jgi:hypothetical protein
VGIHFFIGGRRNKIVLLYDPDSVSETFVTMSEVPETKSETSVATTETFAATTKDAGL